MERKINVEKNLHSIVLLLHLVAQISLASLLGAFGILVKNLSNFIFVSYPYRNKCLFWKLCISIRFGLLVKMNINWREFSSKIESKLFFFWYRPHLFWIAGNPTWALSNYYGCRHSKKWSIFTSVHN